MKNSEVEIDGIVSIRELEYLLEINRDEISDLQANFFKYYHPHYKKQKGKKKNRKIDHPKGTLKKVQKRIAKKILSKIEMPEGFFGYIKDKSYIDNALYHLGQSVVISIDIKNFFPSVSDKEVFNVFRYYLNYSPKISGILTRLTTFNHGLPQGASTSGYLANMSILPIFLDIKKLAEKYNLRLSIYADDITLSGEISQKSSEILIKSILQILGNYGFSSMNSKIEMMHKSKRQCVTGLMVNNKRLSISPEKINEYRMKLADIKRSQESKKGILSFITLVNRKLLKKILF